MSLITGLFDSSLLQALSTDSGGGLKKSERANTTRDQPRPGDEVRRGWGREWGQRSLPSSTSVLPQFFLRSPFRATLNHLNAWNRLFWFKTPNGTISWMVHQTNYFLSFFPLQPDCRSEMPVRFVNACASGASCIYVLFNRDNHSVSAWKLG